MSLLGIDIGTTGCKSVAFSLTGDQLARSYRDYEIVESKEGYAEFDPAEIWKKVKDCFERLKGPFNDIDLFFANGGGSVSGKWLQITADILGKTIIRNKITEASSLGAAIIAGKGCKVFATFDDSIDSMVKKDKIIYPDLSKKEFYDKKFEQYKIISER